MLLLRQLDHLPAQQRPSGQIKRRCSLALTDLPGLPVTFFPGSAVAQIPPFQFEVQLIQNHLLPLTILAGEQRAQILMPRNNQIEGLLQLVNIQLATDGDRHGKVVASTAGLKLVQEPQSFLGKAQRQPLPLRSIHWPYAREHRFSPP